MQKKKNILVSVVALINEEDKVFLARRPLHKHMGGLWEFPGGKIEEGETPEDALKREIQEELQVDISKTDMFPLSFISHEYENFHLLMPLFGCRKWFGDIDPQEHIETAWVAPDDMKNYDLVPANDPLIPILQKLV